jgi:hypothetical protein
LQNNNGPQTGIDAFMVSHNYTNVCYVAGPENSWIQIPAESTVPARNSAPKAFAGFASIETIPTLSIAPNLTNFTTVII